MDNTLVRKNVCILGCGQLARFLILKAHNMGLKTSVLAKSSKSPAVVPSTNVIKGSLHSKKDLKKILKQADWAAFENEFVNIHALKTALSELKTNSSPRSLPKIHPKPVLMQALQDRFYQKKLLKKYKVPTADFVKIEAEKAKKEWVRSIKLFPKGLILKKQRAGYDGKGVFVAKPSDFLLKAPLLFIQNSNGVIAEPLISFKRELALILARNKKNQIIEFPLVETYQDKACCVWVKGPVQHKKKSALVKKLKNFIKQINYIGVIAFELFDTPKGLLVNELAPRVHNSGHYSLTALSEDQFTLHIKAILNKDLKKPKLKAKGFAMLNLLAQKNVFPNKKGRFTIPNSQKLSPKAELYWYGKKEFPAGRKMGHINILSSSAALALNKLLKHNN